MPVAHLGGIAVSVGLATLYGLAAQRFFRANSAVRHPGVLSLSFLIGVPVALGVAVTSLATAAGGIARGDVLLLPCLACLLLAGATALLRWEARVAMVMALPLCLLAASVGGPIGVLLVAGEVPGPLRDGLLGLLLVAPFLLALLEQRRRVPDSFREQRSVIPIAANPAAIWRNIIRVPPLARGERRWGFLAAIGVPRPREATLSHEGVGGIRMGHFEHGIAFRETIVEWREGEVLGFDLTVEHRGATASPLQAIGGPHFAVLAVVYRLEPLPDGRTLLHLASRIRVTTPFNRYAGLWLDAIMRDFQRSILRVIKGRCER